MASVSSNTSPTQPSSSVVLQMNTPNSSPTPAPSSVNPSRRCPWPAILCTCGVASNGVSLALSVTLLRKNRPALYTVCSGAAVSAIIHIIEGIVLSILQPQKDLQNNVEAVGRASANVQTQLKALESQVESLGQLNFDLQVRINTERKEREAAHNDLIGKIAEVTSLSSQLKQANQGLSEARKLTEVWRNATEHVSRQIALLPTGQLSGGIEGLTQQLGELHLSQASLSNEVTNLTSGTTHFHEVESSWNTMIQKVGETFCHLAEDAANKRKLLEEADTRIQSLQQRTKELEGVDQRLQELLTKYSALVHEFEETKKQMSELAPLLNSEEFKTFMAKFIQQP